MEKEFRNIFGFKIYLGFKCANSTTFDDVITKFWCLVKLYIVFKRPVASSAAIHCHEVRKGNKIHESLWNSWSKISRWRIALKLPLTKWKFFQLLGLYPPVSKKTDTAAVIKTWIKKSKWKKWKMNKKES